MKLCTERELIRVVAERWKEQYHGGRSAWGTIYGDRNCETIYNALRALDPNTATAAEVSKIIGNESWSAYFCSSCSEYRTSAIEFGCDTTIHVCEECMKRAVAMFPQHSSAGAEPK